jgi:hypothetical protein
VRLRRTDCLLRPLLAPAAGYNAARFFSVRGRGGRLHSRQIAKIAQAIFNRLLMGPALVGIGL